MATKPRLVILKGANPLVLDAYACSTVWTKVSEQGL